MSQSLPIGWRARPTPLAPCAAVGFGEVASELARRLLALPGGSLRAVHSTGLLCVLGAEPELPWVDGVVYLGRDPRAPALRLPTFVEPNVEPELLQRAVLARVESLGAAAPVAVTSAPPRLFSVADAKLISAEGLRAWLGEA